MDIFEKFNDFGKNWGKAKNLADVFDNALRQVDLTRNLRDMDSVFKLIGGELLKSNVSSIISVISENGDKILFRHFSLGEKLAGILPFEKGRESELSEFRCYKESFEKLHPVYVKDRISALQKHFPDMKANQAPAIGTNSIISPLLLKSQLIGFIELLSDDLEKKDNEAVFIFSERLMARITDIILFHEIKESEKRQRDIYEHAKEGFIFMNGRERRFSDTNKAMTDITGYTPEELRKMDFADVFHPEERQRIDSYVKARLENSYNTKFAPINYETRLRTKDGQTKHVKITVARIVSNDEWFSIIEDITERKMAESSLKKSEEKYRMLIDNAIDAVIIFDETGQVNFANSAFSKLTEYKEDDLKRLNVSTLFGGDAIGKIKDLAIGKTGNEEPSSIDLRMETKDGNEKFVNITATVATNGHKAGSYQAILRDVTETKALYKKIHGAKIHFEQVIDTIQDGICVINKNHEMESCNKFFAEKVNMPIEKIKGLFCHNVMPGYECDLFKNHCTKKNKSGCVAKTVFDTGEILHLTEKNKDKDGSIRYHRFSLFPSKNENGEINKIVITIRDITERKKWQEKIRRLNEFNKRILDNSPVSIIVLDKEGKIIMINNFARKMMLMKEENILYSSLLETKAIKSNREVAGKYQRLLEKGEPFYHDDISYMPKDSNSKVHLNIIAVPLFDENKKVDGAISMAIDNTEAVHAKQRLEELNHNLEKKVEQRTVELDKANKELAKVLELKSKFISDASHELRTPLTIIQGNLDLAIQEKRNEKEEIPEFYHLINKELGRMTKILSDLTTLTNADANTERFEYDLINLDQLINATSHSLEVLALQKNIKIKIDHKNPKNLFIWGDEARIEKMILNIIRNAIKYTDKNGRIKIAVKSVDKKAVISIEDNGVGIPKEDQDYIFERFYRVDKARSRAEGGTGLGLAICKWIAEAHRGSIKVESTLGEGSKFTITLPFDYKGVEAKAGIS